VALNGLHCVDHRCNKRSDKNKKTLKNVKNVEKIKDVCKRLIKNAAKICNHEQL